MLTEQEEQFCVRYVELRAGASDESAYRRGGLAYQYAFGLKSMYLCQARADALARTAPYKQCIEALRKLPAFHATH